MKFEFVEFYPVNEKTRGRMKKGSLGTLHIYAIDCELDIRGISVVKQGKGIYFHFPHFFGFDTETGEETRYPLFRWTNQTTHQEMMDFLKNEIKPMILERLNSEFKK